MPISVPVRPEDTHVPDIQRRAQLQDLPLGTAEWFRFPDGVTPGYEQGDFFLSRLPSGEPVGLKDDRHILVTAGTRSGKGISIIIPNLAYWLGSAVVIDPKGENAIVTARRRGNGSAWSVGMGQKVRILDPFGEVRSPHDDFADLKATFNPLDVLKVDREESVDEAARIAEALIVREGSTSEPFWDEAARAMLKAVILHVVSWKDYAPEDRTLIKVRTLIMAGDAELRRLIALNTEDNRKVPSGFALLFDAMSRNKAFGGVVAAAGEQFRQMEASAPRVLASIAQVACANTDFLDSPAMRRSLARSSFALSELKTERQGMSLYLCLPQRMMGTHYRWLRLMATLTITEMERIREKPRSGHPVLMVLDEFAGLQRMKVIENAAAQIAGFGVKMMFVVQSLAQLKEVYKDNWETLLANCGLKLFFCNDDHFSRDYASKLIGNCEVIRTAGTRSSTTGESRSTTDGTTTGTSRSHAFGNSTTTNLGGRDGPHYSNTFSSTATYGESFSRSTSETKGASQSWTEGSNDSIQQRPLVTPDEVGRLFGDRDTPRALALISGMQPLYLERVRYFKNRDFAGRYDPHPDHPVPLTLKQRKAIADAARRELERRRAEARRKAEEDARKAAEAAERQARLAALAKAQAEAARRRQALIEKLTLMVFLGVAIVVGGTAGYLLRQPEQAASLLHWLGQLFP